jgi:putative addiction module component (TIGR02574 family)
MSERAEQIVEEALRLPPVERAVVVEQLLFSLDRPDPQIDTLWAREAEDRLAAYEAGQLQALPAEEVFAELEQAGPE